MTPLDDIPALQINGDCVSLAQVLRTLGHAGKTSFLIDAARELLMEQAARERGLTVADEDLQAAADQFREKWNLYDAQETHDWLAARNWNVRDLERHLELQILRERLVETIATPEQIEQHVADYRRTRDQARLAQILVAERSLAEELATQIDDEDADFAALARQYSTDEATARLGGELGLVNRTALSPPVEPAVFAASAGDIVGPIETPRGFHLIRIHELIRGRMDDAAEGTIRAELLEKWIDQELSRADVSCPLFDRLAESGSA